MTVLVVGATGDVGGRVLAGLLARQVPVLATSRRPEKAGLPDGVEVLSADLAVPESFAAAMAGVDRVFLYAEFDDPDGFAAMMRTAGVRRVVLLSSSAVMSPNAATDFNGARFHRAEHAIAGSGLEWTFLRPGSFANNAARWSWAVARDGAVPLPYPDAVQAPVHEQDIADVAVHALTTDVLTGSAPVLTGPETVTLREQVAAIGAALGEHVGVIEQTDAEARAQLSRHVSAGWADFIVSGWRDAVGATPEISGDYSGITGAPARSFTQWAVDRVDLFRQPRPARLGAG